jgi:hypothetical protein
MLIGCIGGEAPVAAVLESITKDGLAREFLPDSHTAREERFLDSLEAHATAELIR